MDLSKVAGIKATLNAKLVSRVVQRKATELKTRVGKMTIVLIERRLSRDKAETFNRWKWMSEEKWLSGEKRFSEAKLDESSATNHS